MPNSNLKITLRDAVFLKSVGVSFDDCEFLTQENHQMDENTELRNQLAKALEAETARLQRKGVPSLLWCYYCGTMGETRDASAFLVGGDAPNHLACAQCERAIRDVSRFLRVLFELPVTIRSDSRRACADRELYRASKEICGATDTAVLDGSYDMDAPDFRFYVAQAEVYSDTKAKYEKKIRDAFRRSKFLDFHALAAALERQREQALYRQLRRALSNRLTRGIYDPPVQKIATPDESESFYK